MSAREQVSDRSSRSDDTGGQVNPYHTALVRVWSLPRAEREAEWVRLSLPLREAHVRQDYAYCPVCKAYLDWAWCPVCGKYR